MSAGGKGSDPRPFSVSREDFAARWDRIFGKKVIEIVAQPDVVADKPAEAPALTWRQLELDLRGPGGICDQCETVSHCMRHGCIPLQSGGSV